MALKIIIAEGLDNTIETCLFRALQDCGAVHYSNDEWHQQGRIVRPSDFLACIKQSLRSQDRDEAYADKLTVTPLRGQDVTNKS